MQKIGTLKHYCRMCKKELSGKDLQDNSWVCPECNQKQLSEHGFSSLEVVELEKRETRDARYTLRQRSIEHRGFLTIDDAAEISGVSRRTMFDWILRYRHFLGITKSGNQTLIKKGKLRKFREFLKAKDKWICEYGDNRRLITLEKALKVTGLSRRWIKKLIKCGAVNNVEVYRGSKPLTPEEIHALYVSPRTANGNLTPEMCSWFIKKCGKNPSVVFVDSDQVLDRGGRCSPPGV